MMRGFPKELWSNGKYAVYQATKEWPLPAGQRCISSKGLLVAVQTDPTDEFRGIMMRPGIRSGYAKYLIVNPEANELGEISL